MQQNMYEDNGIENQDNYEELEYASGGEENSEGVEVSGQPNQNNITVPSVLFSTLRFNRTSSGSGNNYSYP